MNRRTLVTAALAAAFAVPATAAQAADYCVAPATGCDQDKTFAANGTGLVDALAAAKATAGPHRVKVGPGIYSAPTTAGFVHEDPTKDAVEIVGAGRDQTVLTAPAGATTVLKLNSGASSIHDLRVLVPAQAATNGTGILANGAGVADVTVVASSQQSNSYRGLFVHDATVERAKVALPAGSSTGIELSGAAAARDVDVSAYAGIRARNHPAILVERATVAALTAYGVTAEAAGVTLRDSVVRHSGFTAGGLLADAQNGTSAHLVADGVTIVGGAGGAAVRAANGNSTTSDATVAVRNTVIRGFQRTLEALQSGTGAVAVTTDWSDYDAAPARIVQTGAGTVGAEHHSFVADPGFAGANDLRLAAGSPLADAGDPAAPAEDRKDLAGLARDRDGNGDCAGRRDIGAYELVLHAPTAKASASSAVAGADVTFDGGASCDPDADALTYTWHFQDGTSMTGAKVVRSFAEAGPQKVTLVVSDGVETASDGIAIEVAQAPAPALPLPGSDPQPGTGETPKEPATMPPAGDPPATEPGTVLPSTGDPVALPPAPDRAAPRIAKLRAVRRAGKLRVRFTLDEAATVVVRAGRRRVTRTLRAGAQSLALRARGAKVTVVATDRAGNAAKLVRRVRGA